MIDVDVHTHVHAPRRAEDSARAYVNFDMASSRAMHISKPDASMGGRSAATDEPSHWPSD
jgi:hypothetical protein